MGSKQEKILRAKNAELEHTLAHKNRELEIETALAHVRAVALSMQQPADMLAVCREICRQLQLLGVEEIRNVQTAIIYESRGIYINYEYYRLYDKTFITEVDYSHPIQFDFVNQMLKEGAYLTLTLEGAELTDWLEYQKTTNQFIDTHLAGVSSLNYNWFSIGPVALGISLYAPISDDGLALFKRFLEVFRLAYRRYKDVEQALAQAKEARIETALERVRAVAMSMKKAEDAYGVCEVTYNELLALGFTNLRNTQIVISKKETKSYIVFEHSAYGGTLMREAPVGAHPLMKEITDEIEKSNDAMFQKQVTGEEFEAWRKWRKLSLANDPRLDTISSLCFYFYSIGMGALGISSYDPITEQELTILKRFKKVFELAYTRYADVAQAEAQAKEARIETALERVRAVAMAMRKPDELGGIGETLFTELKALDFSDLRNTEIIINNKPTETAISYYYSDYGITGVIEFDLNSNPTIKAWAEEIKKADDAFAEVIITENEIGSWRDYRILLGYLPDPKLDAAKTVYYYSYSIGQGALSISSFSPIGAEQIKVLRRFRNVFNLSYQRYADVAQAEAQARESKIETALEKVRSRSLTMHKSDELEEVALKLTEQVKALGIETYTSGVNICHENHQTIDSWMSNPTGAFNPLFQIPTKASNALSRLYNAWKNGEQLLAVDLINDDLNKHYAFLRSFPLLDAAFKRSEAAGVTTPGRQVLNSAFFKYGYLLFVTAAPIPQFHDIFKRFARVFEQAYIRFIDLQKAEEQTREAKIETALERVRSRSMGMQKSDELKEVIQIIYDQFVHLNIAIEHTGFVVDYTPGGDWHFWIADPHGAPNKLKVANYDCAWNNSFNQAKEKSIDFFATLLDFDEKNKFYRDLFNHAGPVPEEAKAVYLSKPGLAISTVLMEDVALYIENFEGIPYTYEENATLMRFGKVFQQTYTRFIDLQKAETQARDAQIEVSLERVRSRAMAMHKSEDLQTAVSTVFEELEKLNLGLLRCGIGIIDKAKRTGDIWTTVKSGGESIVQVSGNEPFDIHPLMEGTFNAWLAQTDFSYTLDGADLAAYYRAVATTNFTLPGSQSVSTESDGLKQYYYTPTFKSGNLYAFKDTAFTDDAKKVIQRFASVLSLTFNRFLDLQKAEAQAKESQIQLALERVRARTMAMQHSDELSETVFILFEQFKELGENPDQATIGVINEEERVIEYWVTMYGSRDSRVFKFSIDEPHVTRKLYDAWKGHEKSLVIDLQGQDLKDFSRYRESKGGAAYNNAEKQRIINAAFFSKGLVNVQSTAPRSAESVKLLERFAAVFDGTYTRFLDLQKAELQARETQIELALERVRAKTMAMHRSDELGKTALLLFQQLNELGLSFFRIGFYIWREDADLVESWPSNGGLDGILPPVSLPFNEDKGHRGIHDAALRGESTFELVLGGEELARHYDWVAAHSDPEVIKRSRALGITLPDPQYKYAAIFNGGYLMMIAREPKPAALGLLMRFAKVFEQTYTRFLDLQKAEAQAREGQVQLALERIRARTMAMQHSDELLETSGLLSQQFYDLGTNAQQISIAIINEERGIVELSASVRGVTLPQIVEVRMDQPMVMGPTCKAWKEGKKSLEIILEGERLNEYNKLRNRESGNKFDLDKKGPDAKWIVNVVMFSKGYLACSTDTPVAPETRQLLARFGGVFEQTYTRFLDLQKAEAQAREAQIAAGLERVRSRTMAMQNSDELAESAAVVFQQLISLGIEPNRLFIGIITDDSGDMELWATEEDGSKISTRFTGNIYRNGAVKKMFDGWKEQRSHIIIDMKGKELKEYFHYLADELKVPFQLGLHQKRRIQSIAYFSKGFIGMASTDEQPAETIKLLERFAGVFNLTFVRFHDLQVAEAHAAQAEQDLILLIAEKKRAEDALTELRATQTQLVQKEKMASLGELTAGIAHEIQNPLNFVNNFSEVNREMIDELEEELKSGNIEEALAIATDIKQNEEKISHHGKRADSIVKGMLQHSRASTGEKQLTDLNLLADEFFKLSYHGLRAKDKDFNAEMTTHFDDTLPKIYLIQQDMGRVLLNLFNNAFYAVNQKKKTAGSDYKPRVVVSTSVEKNNLMIKVKDNGDGIPDEIKDKIMQPFFTTKPTGEGTGLGLSLSYDIVVKGHGGNVNIIGAGGEGAEFIIQLPV